MKKIIAYIITISLLCQNVALALSPDSPCASRSRRGYIASAMARVLGIATGVDLAREYGLRKPRSTYKSPSLMRLFGSRAFDKRPAYLRKAKSDGTTEIVPDTISERYRIKHQKVLALVEHANINEDDVVLDPFAGSGGIVLAAAFKNPARIMGSDYAYAPGVSRGIQYAPRENWRAWLEIVRSHFEALQNLVPPFATPEFVYDDAERLENLKKQPGLKFTKIISEPPFGWDSKIITGKGKKECYKLFIAHLRAVHDLLADNGEAFYIIPTKWISKLKREDIPYMVEVKEEKVEGKKLSIVKFTKKAVAEKVPLIRIVEWTKVEKVDTEPKDDGSEIQFLGGERRNFMVTERVKFGSGGEVKEYWAKYVSAEYSDQENICVVSQADILNYLNKKGIQHICEAAVFLELDNGRKVILFEGLPPGKTLWERLHEEYTTTPITEKESLDIIYKVALILRELHKVGIYHWDIKLSNIWVADNGEVRLIDFDLAFGTKEEFEERGFATRGTPIYKSKRRLEKKIPCDEHGNFLPAEDDVYSLAMALYIVLSSDRIPLGANAHNYIEREKNISPKLKKVLHKALDNGECQYKTADEFIKAIEECGMLEMVPHSVERESVEINPPDSHDTADALSRSV